MGTSSSKVDIEACRDVVVHKVVEAKLSAEFCRASSTI